MPRIELQDVEKMEALGDVKGLIEAALDRRNTAKVTGAASQTLCQIGDPHAVKPLIVALEDENENVRQAAANALDQIGIPHDEELPIGVKDAKMSTYRLSKTSLGNPLDVEVTTERECVYCEHLRDQNLRDPGFPKGVGECSNYDSSKSVVGFDDSCTLWKSNSKVRFWLSKGYMRHNLEGWPITPWYQVFDDGPDGEKGTR